MLKNWLKTSYIDYWSYGMPVEVTLTGDSKWCPSPRADWLHTRRLRRGTKYQVIRGAGETVTPRIAPLFDPAVQLTNGKWYAPVIDQGWIEIDRA